MDGRTLDLTNCSDSALPCFRVIEAAFFSGIERKVWRVYALLVTEAVLAGIIVGVGAYGQRYRHHPFTRFIFLGATTLFLPIVSSVVSTISNSANPNYVQKLIMSNYDGLYALVATCSEKRHYSTLIVWALLVQIVMVNTSTIVATEGREERRSIGPPIDLIVQGVWTIYLGVTFVGHDMIDIHSYFSLSILLIAPFVLLCAKIVLKFYAFQKARRSFALARNPGLTFVYMEKLQEQEANQQNKLQVCSDPPPPPLLVMREDEKEVEIQACGYAFKDDSGTVLRNNIGLVTFDRIWQLDSIPSILTPELKGLCLSFALFKLLRCRFARYKLTDIGSMGTLTFLRRLSLQYGKHDIIFRVIADELSFIHDYYYSSLPISYATWCLPILNTLLSLLTLCYCILLDVLLIRSLVFRLRPSKAVKHIIARPKQLECKIWWINGHLVPDYTTHSFGSTYMETVLLILFPVLVLIVEVRDMASYVCCNWTKVTLICRYVINQTSSQHSLRMQKWVISFLLRCRCKLIMKQHWNEEMSQCSVLALHHRTTLPAFVRRLLPLPDQKWKIKVTAAVKDCIINALRSAVNGGLGKGVSSLRRSQVSESFLWACNGKGTSDIILIWHIATCIIQVRHRSSGKASDSDHKTVATQLSQYCAYLMSWCPELLPDNGTWSTSLYRAVKKDAEGALVGFSMAEYSLEEEAKLSTAEDTEHPVSNQLPRQEDGYEKLVRLLSENSKNEVLKDGVKLGKQLVETIEDQKTLWKLLAEFWSEMILYLAPSDNLKGHSEAIARGGELITLLWALLFHAGIMSRSGGDDGTVATSAGVV